MGFWDAVASARPYAINLHIAPDITTPTSHRSGCSSWHPTKSAKALTAVTISTTSPPKKLTLLLGHPGPHLIHVSWSRWVHILNNILISSAALTQLTFVTNTQTHRPTHTHTDHRTLVRHVSFMRICDCDIFWILPHFSHISAKCIYRIFFPHKLAFSMAILIFFVFLFKSIFNLWWLCITFDRQQYWQ